MAEEEKKDSDKEKEEAQGVTGEIFKGIGKVIPGLGGLIKGLQNLPTFREKLKEVDKEVERKIKETPLSGGKGGSSRIPGSIPRGVRGGIFKRKFFVKQSPKEKPPFHQPSQERPADIFDEGDYVKVIVEIPGVEEKDIKVNLKEDRLTISVDIPNRQYHKELKLPCVPKGELEQVYKNGILEVKVKKYTDDHR